MDDQFAQFLSDEEKKKLEREQREQEARNKEQEQRRDRDEMAVKLVYEFNMEYEDACTALYRGGWNYQAVLNHLKEKKSRDKEQESEQEMKIMEVI
jgi:hypothetical protein